MMVSGVHGWGWVVYGQMFLNVLTSNGLRTAKALKMLRCSDVRFFNEIVYTSQKPPLSALDLRTRGGTSVLGGILCVWGNLRTFLCFQWVTKNHLRTFLCFQWVTKGPFCEHREHCGKSMGYKNTCHFSILYDRHFWG